jgi:hypothetical protein
LATNLGSLLEGGEGADLLIFRIGVSFECFVREFVFELGVDRIGLCFDR